jgi:putative oxidoreductase
MEKILSVDNNTNLTNIALLIARIGISALMLTHGIPKLMMLLSGATEEFPPVMGMSPEIPLGLAVFAEVICTVFILAVFATRLAAIPLIITMLVAVVLFHAADPISGKEPALLHMLVYIVLLLAGGGKYSIDGLLQRNRVIKSSRSSEVNYASRSI